MASGSFLNRPYAYAIGVCLLPVATVIYLIGLVSPYWSETREGGSSVIRGLWTTCEPGSSLTLTNCQNRIVVAEDWLRGVQLMQCVGLVLLVFACVMAIVLNISPKRRNNQTIELLGGFGAMFALFSVSLYPARTGIPFDNTFPVTFSWGFGLDLSGGLLALLSIILIAVTNMPRDLSRDGRRKRGIERRKKGDNWLQSYRPKKTVIDDRKLLLVPADNIYWISNV